MSGEAPALSFLIVTVSDRAAAGVYEDGSGPAIHAVLQREFPGARIEGRVVPDEEGALRGALVAGEEMDVVLTTGGTGLGPRDITPEVTAAHCERELPGVAETLRRRSYEVMPTAMLSRGYAGLKGSTIYVNLPGSVSGARDCTEMLVPVLSHAVETLRGAGHE